MDEAAKFAHARNEGKKEGRQEGLKKENSTNSWNA